MKQATYTFPVSLFMGKTHYLSTSKMGSNISCKACISGKNPALFWTYFGSLCRGGLCALTAASELESQAGFPVCPCLRALCPSPARKGSGLFGSEDCSLTLPLVVTSPHRFKINSYTPADNILAALLGFFKSFNAQFYQYMILSKSLFILKPRKWHLPF